ncbi:thiol-disulfide oxidoreductase DCC family protein [Zhongshania arctica]|uniref:Thiol-disulfide oxidoreductase DCC family protein n=1 Tax=Zhongshania arctica TaxID=3238302 RepID=A0ABV3TU82_9GAMM
MQASRSSKSAADSPCDTSAQQCQDFEASAASNTPQLTFFYDGQCPLCMKEIRMLNRWNTSASVAFVNLLSTEAMIAFPEVDIDDAQKSLLAFTSDGATLRGVDATYAVWAALGKGHWMAPLNWRWLRPITLLAYRVFARYRHQLALLLTGQRRCASCELPAPPANKTDLKN